MTDREKIDKIFEVFNFATDKDNPARVAFELEDQMYGSLMSSVQSYDLMDNPKYKKLQNLIQAMNQAETDGSADGNTKDMSSSPSIFYNAGDEEHIKLVPESKFQPYN